MPPWYRIALQPNKMTRATTMEVYHFLAGMFSERAAPFLSVKSSEFYLVLCEFDMFRCIPRRWEGFIMGDNCGCFSGSFFFCVTYLK